MRRLQSPLVVSSAKCWAKRGLNLGLCGLLSSCATDHEFEQGLRDSETGQGDDTSQESNDDDDTKVQSGQSDNKDTSTKKDEDQHDDSSSEQEPPAKPDPKAQLAELIENYCDLGSTSCYLMDEIENELLPDKGEADLSINPKDSKIVDPNLSSYPFKKALQLVRGGQPESMKRFTLPERGIMGFDVWIKPNSTGTQTRWNAVAIDGFLSLQTLGPDRMACTYKVGLSPTLPLIPKAEVLKAAIEFPKDKFVHVACAYDGNNVSLWINGVENKGPRHDRVILPETSRYLLNWSSALQTPFDGQMGPFRIWHDIPTMSKEIRKLHQLLAVRDLEEQANE